MLCITLPREHSLRVCRVGVEQSKEMKGKFRIAGKSLFMTYPRCKVGIKEAFKQLKEIIEERTNRVKDYMIVQEKHMDGEDHIKCI